MSADVEALVWVRRDALPSEAAGWLDPDSALPPDVTFIPSVVQGFAPWGLVGLGLIPAMFALLLLPDLPESWVSPRADERFGNTGFFLILVVVAAAIFRTARRAHRLRADKEAGRLRFGVFLGPRSFLFRGGTPEGCVYLPRSAVGGARIVVITASGTDYSTPVVDFSNADGTAGTAPQIFGPYTPLTNAQLVERITEWAVEP